ncbi:hypothetical protein [Curtobacterium sp. HSID17257]|uniref:hypothetical protein n=1 Tax=Curtobacterium sp. HSID17257 TaxID=2419510 RepID=UPI0019310DAE|nr:hypothetical protein [Curtobacterium sp. HSID17257]
MQETSSDRWFAVRCVFRYRPGTYEERIVTVLATSAEDAIAKAEDDAAEYADTLGAEYLGLAQSYELFDEPGDGAEVFSLMRDSDLPDDAYLDAFFDTGGERQRDMETPAAPPDRPAGPPVEETSPADGADLAAPGVGSTDAGARSTWTINHFSQSNPAGDGQGDVAALLRRVAQTIDDLGDVSIEDITFASSVTAGEDDLTVTVSFHPEPRRR